MNNITRGGRWDLSSKRYVPLDGRSLDRFSLARGDVLFNATNSPDLIGKTAFVESLDEPTVFSNHFLRLRTLSRRLDSRYLARWLQLQFDRGTFSAICQRWVNQASVPRERLLGLSVPLPSLEEQRRIADLLDRVDTLRATRAAVTASLDSLAEATFLGIVGDPRPERSPWPTGRIGDLLDSAQYGTSARAGGSGSHPILRMGNITKSGRIDVQDLKYLDLPEGDLDKYSARAGDVLFNRTNSPDLVGKAALYGESEPMVYAGYLIRLRLLRSHRPEYLAGFLNSRYAKQALRAMCKAIVGMANINAKELQAMLIPVPPPAIQERFAEATAQIGEIRGRARRHDAHLDLLFASLQDRAFAGEL